MFVHERKVTYSEVSESGHVDAAQIADYFQDCSCFQSDSLGGGVLNLQDRKLAWMLASWQIVVDRYPLYGEAIRVTTAPYAFDSYFGYRNFTIEDSEGRRIAVANSKWVMVDVVGGHPVKIDESISGIYELSEKEDMDYASRKIFFKGEYTQLPEIIVPGFFTDTNKHVNNAQYIRLALEYLPEGFVPVQVRCEYKNAAVKGDRICPRVITEDQMVKVALTDGENKTYVIVEMTQKA